MKNFIKTACFIFLIYAPPFLVCLAIAGIWTWIATR